MTQSLYHGENEKEDILYNVPKGEKPQCSKCKSKTTWIDQNDCKHWYYDKKTGGIVCWDCNQGPKWAEFAYGIKAPATKKGYGGSIRRYMRHLKLAKADDLFLTENPKDIQSKVIDFIMTMRNEGVSYATMKFIIAPIFSFYKLHDINLNRKRILRNLGDYNTVVKDEAYTDEQIQQALQNADQRMKVVLLLEASTGCRVGALAGVTLGDLTLLPDYGLYKIVFYKHTPHVYCGFTTREAASIGIDNYLLYRQRCGEKLSYSEKKVGSKIVGKWEPEDTPLI